MQTLPEQNQYVFDTVSVRAVALDCTRLYRCPWNCFYPLRLRDCTLSDSFSYINFSRRYFHLICQLFENWSLVVKDSATTTSHQLAHISYARIFVSLKGRLSERWDLLRNKLCRLKLHSDRIRCCPAVVGGWGCLFVLDVTDVKQSGNNINQLYHGLCLLTLIDCLCLLTELCRFSQIIGRKTSFCQHFAA